MLKNFKVGVEFLKVALRIAKKSRIIEEFFQSPFELPHYYYIKHVSQIHETGDRRSIDNSFIAPKEKTTPSNQKRWVLEALGNAILSWFFI